MVPKAHDDVNKTLRHHALLVVLRHFLNSIATTRPSSFNCDAVGGTLGTLVIVLVFLLVGVTASLVYFTVKLKCNSREEHQPTNPQNLKSKKRHALCTSTFLAPPSFNLKYRGRILASF